MLLSKTVTSDVCVCVFILLLERGGEDFFIIIIFFNFKEVCIRLEWDGRLDRREGAQMRQRGEGKRRRAGFGGARSPGSECVYRERMMGVKGTVSGLV